MDADLKSFRTEPRLGVDVRGHGRCPSNSEPCRVFRPSRPTVVLLRRSVRRAKPKSVMTARVPPSTAVVRMTLLLLRSP